MLIPGADWGHNLDAFNAILHGGFAFAIYGYVELLIFLTLVSCS